MLRERESRPIRVYIYTTKYHSLHVFLDFFFGHFGVGKYSPSGSVSKAQGSGPGGYKVGSRSNQDFRRELGKPNKIKTGTKKWTFGDEYEESARTLSTGVLDFGR